MFAGILSSETASEITKVLVNTSVPDHTPTFLIGMTTCHEAYGLRYHSDMLAVRLPDKVSRPVYRDTDTVGVYAQLGPLF